MTEREQQRKVRHRLAEFQDAHAKVRRAKVAVDAACMRDRIDRLMVEPPGRTIDHGLGIEL